MDEDESGLYVGNWGCSISNAGWTDSNIGHGGGMDGAIWAHSDMQTFSLWNEEVMLSSAPQPSFSSELMRTLFFLVGTRT